MMCVIMMHKRLMTTRDFLDPLTNEIIKRLRPCEAVGIDRNCSPLPTITPLLKNKGSDSWGLTPQERVEPSSKSS